MKVDQARKIVAVILIAAIASAYSAAASLNVHTDKESYNLGDQIVSSYDFTRDQDFSGLVKLSLYCTGFELEFYTLPTNTYAGQTQQVTVPPLSVTSGMLGRCYIAANATTYDRLVNESSTSNFFNVTSQAGVRVSTQKTAYLPSEAVEVSGTVEKSHSLPAGVVMGFLGTNYASTVSNNTFAYSIKLPKNIRSGRHTLEFTMNDSFGNSGSAQAEFEVAAVPTRLVNTASSQNVRPGEDFTISALVYDQADDTISSDVSFRITDAAGTVIVSATNSTGTAITVAFPAGQAPGTYTLTSTAQGLAAATPLAVEEVENITVMFENGVAVVSNTGNVNYEKQFNITLAGEKKTYIIVEELALQPGQAFEVDLTRTVPAGEYAISFPEEAEAPAVESAQIQDNRPIVKKALDFLGITGKNVMEVKNETGQAGGRGASPLVLLAGLTAVAVAGLYMARGRKARRPKGREPEGQERHEAKEDNAPKHPAESDEERVRRIMEEKRRQQFVSERTKPKSLREDPQAQKFVRDMMKDKPFR